MNKNIIVIPPFYEGTSFEDIVRGFIEVIEKKSLPIDFIGNKKALKNNLDGDFLDDERYILGQNDIIKKVIKYNKVKKILFIDFFNPGLDLIKYYHQQQGINVKYGSLFHGGTFLEDDLYSFDWLNKFEKAWFGVYDTIYTSSKYTIKSCPKSKRSKFKVLPWGMDGIKLYTNNSSTKEWDVVFPHRLNSDKGIENLLKIIKMIPNLSFAITVPQKFDKLRKNKFYKKIIKNKNVTFVINESRLQHLKTLSKSRVILSCAKQELFGYSIMKGVLSGCIPVLPNKLCYPEFFDNKFLYKNIDEAVYLIEKFVNQSKSLQNIKKIEEIKNFIAALSFEKILLDFFD